MEKPEIRDKNIEVYKQITNETAYNWNNNNFLLESLGDNFNRYVRLLCSFEGYIRRRVIEQQDIISNVIENLMKTLSHYLKGEIPQSYDFMRDALASINKVLLSKSRRRATNGIEIGFKARDAKGKDVQFSREDMFHIPFDSRHLVGNNRFSIHGIPSIYLGQSIYTCYLETKRPELNDFWVSLFCFTQNPHDLADSTNIKLIDLTYMHYEQYKASLLIKAKRKDEEGYLATLNNMIEDLLLWPFIMSCTITCKHVERSFSEEYIIPQILYQICKENNQFSGVKYYSTMFSNFYRELYKHATVNYAIPAQHIYRDGYCSELEKQLILTEPVTYEMCKKFEVNTEYNFTSNGLPILSNYKNDNQDYDIILKLDKITMYFNNLINSFENNTQVLKPINNNWTDEI